MERFLETFFNPAVMQRYLPDIIAGAGVALWISLAVVVAGIALGLALASLRTCGFRSANFFIICFADIFRALPPLVVILILYFGLPSAGIRLSGPMVLFIVLGLTLAAFAEEAFWAGFSAVDKGQWEAGLSTGLGFGRTLAWVALPQAVRLALPPLVNRVLAITKMTALGSVIGVSEILSTATMAQSFSGSATPLTLAAIAYLVIFLPLVFVARAVESRHFARQGR
ncbi:ABC transporter permease subunit [Rhizobiaceae bacterium BDR2-2]|uniref:ABC transporter permease subunit n=1 Tax=Ectorhizobium quercum TaxID=2965071 RepID=A0AAE3N1E0_9HYPH|nr:ABC transporter permease subunit [Ectorhizobium quercum]MCX8998361.1 ABC transporter permease subunit [Ectorhizobium quercum]